MIVTGAADAAPIRKGREEVAAVRVAAASLLTGPNGKG